MADLVEGTGLVDAKGKASGEFARWMKGQTRAAAALTKSITTNAAALTAFITGGAWGSVLYKGETDWAWLPPGTAGQVLKTNGADANPEWTNLATYTLLTSQATTSGTVFDFVIPSTANKLFVMLNGVSLSGSDHVLIQLGTSGGFISSGYQSASSSTFSSAGFVILAATAGTAYTGMMLINRFSGNIWNESHGATGISGGSGASRDGAGFVDLGAAITQLRITRTGSNTFDDGAVNVAYE